MALLEFGTPRENEERRDGGCAVVFDPATERYAVGERGKDGLLILYSSGVEDGEDMKAGILREVREESGLYDFAHIEKIAEALTHYRNRNKNVNRLAHATCLLAILASADTVPTRLEAHEDFTLRWVTPDALLANWREHNADHGLDHWVYFFGNAVVRAVELGYDRTANAAALRAAADAVASGAR